MPLRPERDARAVERTAATAACRACSAFASLALEEGCSTPSSTIRAELLAPNGYLHAATVVALADTACGFGCIAHLPAGAAELHDDRAQDQFPRHRARRHDRVRGAARAPRRHDAGVGRDGARARPTTSTIALFRCTQMLLWPEAAEPPARARLSRFIASAGRPMAHRHTPHAIIAGECPALR